MRNGPCLMIAAALAGCSSGSIDAGTNPDAGAVVPVDAGLGDAGGATVIASEIQLTPTTLVSDGTSLFWSSGVGPGGPIMSIPVGGGSMTTVVAGMLGSGLLAVDDVNVYFIANQAGGGIYSAPKGGGGSPNLLTLDVDAGASIGIATVLGRNLYWEELTPSGSAQPGGGPAIVTIATAPLPAGAASDLATFSADIFDAAPTVLGVTSTAVFLSAFGGLYSFPISSGIPDGSTPVAIAGTSGGCQNIVSDTDAIYCQNATSITRVGSDGTATLLGTAIDVQSGGMAIDETYVYWADSLTVGTIMRVPKTGGTATIIARDVSPYAIAVDSNAVYWSDDGGNIMRLAK